MLVPDKSTFKKSFVLMGMALAAGASFALLIVRLAPFHTLKMTLLVAAAFCVGYALAVAIHVLFQNDPTKS